MCKQRKRLNLSLVSEKAYTGRVKENSYNQTDPNSGVLSILKLGWTHSKKKKKKKGVGMAKHHWPIQPRPPSDSRLIWGRDLYIWWLHPPDFPRVLSDGAVAGEFPRSSDVPDHLLGPVFRVLIPGTRETRSLLHITVKKEAYRCSSYCKHKYINTVIKFNMYIIWTKVWRHPPPI